MKTEETKATPAKETVATSKDATVQELQRQNEELRRKLEEQEARPMTGEPPEVKEMVEEKMKAGLTMEIALQAARNQYEHDRTNPHDPLPDRTKDQAKPRTIKSTAQ